MKKTILIQLLFILTVMPLCAQDDEMQYIEIDTTLVFNKDWFNLQGQYREVKGQKWLINKICGSGITGYSPTTDSTFPAPNLPCFDVKIPLPEGFEWDDMAVTCSETNLFSVGYRLSPGYFIVWDEPQERKDSLFLAMQTYQYEYERYPEQQARFEGVGVDSIDKHLNPISYAARIMVTPFQYETTQEIILFHPRIRLLIRLKKSADNGSSGISCPQNVNGQTVNRKYFDLTGRRLSTPQTKGVYIEGGKLHVSKLAR